MKVTKKGVIQTVIGLAIVAAVVVGVKEIKAKKAAAPAPAAVVVPAVTK
jgi:hypothetical protein